MAAVVQCQTGFMDSAPTNLLVVLYPQGSDTAVSDGVGALTKAASRKGAYTFTNATLSGGHQIELYANDGPDPFWTGFARLTTTGIVYAQAEQATAVLLDAAMSQIKAKTDNLQFDGSNNVRSVSTVENVGLGDFNIAVSVKTYPDNVPLQGARVTVQMNGVRYAFETTDIYGNIVGGFMLDAGDWLFGIRCNGYTSQSIIFTVNGNDTFPFQLTQLSITPSDPGFVTGYGYVYDEYGFPVDGASVGMVMVKAAPGDTGSLFSRRERVVLTDDLGKYELTQMSPGATYKIRTVGEGTDTGAYREIVAGTDDPFPIPSLVV